MARFIPLLSGQASLVAGTLHFSQHKTVMARFMRAIHVFASWKSRKKEKKDVDDPDKPGHDD
ncbi:hypothetical protein [uncultured Parvibaculum sp.]|uniref:hypothetical protein n=1 Tax=uncultured Parvibaculum sp. TaxID=291828 RepID=UPI0030DDB365|tara:strand:+ start:22288 stop:22473 length:186 start_codon:yes stop_codon:yes gene_type:complete